MRTLTLLTGSLLTALSLAVNAHDHGHDHHPHGHAHDHAEHQHGDTLGAHQHGVASLNLVVADGHVAIELHSPADNLLGFEHLPGNAEELASVRQLKTQLQNVANVIQLPAAAGCNLVDSELSSPLFAALEQADSHAQHKHDHDHDHDHKHDHQAADSAAAHNDIELHYHFDCANAGSLDQLRVTLFEQFPRTERLLLQAVTPKGQQGGELTPANPVVVF